MGDSGDGWSRSIFGGVGGDGLRSSLHGCFSKWRIPSRHHRLNAKSWSSMTGWFGVLSTPILGNVQISVSVQVKCVSVCVCVCAWTSPKWFEDPCISVYVHQFKALLLARVLWNRSLLLVRWCFFSLLWNNLPFYVTMALPPHVPWQFPFSLRWDPRICCSNLCW